MKYNPGSTTNDIGNKINLHGSKTKLITTRKDIKVLFPLPKHPERQLQEQDRRNDTTETSDPTRKTICNWMKTTLNRYCTLSESGTCAFRYNGAVVVVEVPPNNAIKGTFFLYSIVCKDICEANKNEGDLHGFEERLIMRKALESNYIQQETKGGCLSLDGDELTLCFCGDIQQCDTAEKFYAIVSNFVLTVSDLRMDIAMVRSKIRRQRDARKSKSKYSTSQSRSTKSSRYSINGSKSSIPSSSRLSRKLPSINETVSKDHASMDNENTINKKRRRNKKSSMASTKRRKSIL